MQGDVIPSGSDILFIIEFEDIISQYTFIENNAIISYPGGSGQFIVNTIGCFLLGFINSLPVSRKYKLFFGFGFCGSLTTFSGWSFQLFKLTSSGILYHMRSL